MRAPSLLALLAPLLLAGCTSTLGGNPEPLEGRALPFVAVDDCEGRQGSELHRVVATAAEWEQLWRQACGDGSVLHVMTAEGAAPSAPPGVDFGRHVVVASFAGEKPDSGHDHRITNVTAFPDRVRVDVDRLRAGPDCPTAQALTYPHALVVVERFAQPARFVFHDLLQTC